MNADDNTDIFGDTVPSPATAKAPVPQDHLPAAPEPSPVQPRVMADPFSLANVLNRLSYFDLKQVAKEVAAYDEELDQGILAEALGQWAMNAGTD